jgi:branched-chain amino acid transport system substrate-binding protein
MNKKVMLFVIIMVFVTVLFAQEKVVIPVVYGQSRTAVENFVSAEDLKGVTLAAEAINERGGLLGKEVEILDCMIYSFDLETLKTLETKMFSPENLFAIIGANTSGLSKYIAPKIQEKNVIMISPISTAEEITQIGDYIYRACFIDPFQGTAMARFAIEALDAKTAAVLIKTTSPYSVGISRYFIEEFSKTGNVILQQTYAGEDVNYTEILTQVKAANPDVVFVPGHGSDSGLIMKQAHMMGIDSIFLGGDGWGKGALGVAGEEAAEGNYFVNHWHKDVDTSLSKAFVERYESHYGEGLIASSAALAYDALMLLAEAVENAGNFNPSAIKSELDKITGFKGVTGTIDYSRGRDPYNKDAVILKYEANDIVYSTTVVSE